MIEILAAVTVILALGFVGTTIHAAELQWDGNIRDRALTGL